MPRIAASRHGESRLRMLRLVRRGDHHDARGLTVSLEFEGAFDAAFTEGHAEGLIPGEALKSLVHGIVRRQGTREIEEIGLAVAAQVIESQPRIARVKVDIEESRWLRLEAAGRAQAQAFSAREIRSRPSGNCSSKARSRRVRLKLRNTNGSAKPTAAPTGRAYFDRAITPATRASSPPSAHATMRTPLNDSLSPD